MKIGRRHLLRGAGICMALPWLEAMTIPRAQAATPKRLIILHWPTGVPDPTTWWFPKEAGANWLTTPGLKSLEPHRRDFNIVPLTYGPIWYRPNQSDVHSNCVSLLTGYKGVEAARPRSAGASVYVTAAKALGAGTRIPYLASSIYETGGSTFSYFAWSGPGVLDPLEIDPMKMFNRLFSTQAGEANAAAKIIARNKSVLDVVKAEATDLRRQVGVVDRVRIDQHLESVRDLEKSVTALPAVCPATTKPAEFSLDGDRKKYDGLCVGCGGEKTPEYIRTMIALHLAAHRCNLTRVSFISLGPAQTYHSFPELGLPYPFHEITHNTPAVTSAGGGNAGYKKVTTFYMAEVARFLGELKKDSGSGSLLEQSAVVMLTDLGDGGLHAGSPVACLVAGKAGQTGTAAMQTGRQLRVPENAYSVNDLWTSVLQGVGAMSHGQKFGDPSLDTKPISGLWV